MNSKNLKLIPLSGALALAVMLSACGKNNDENHGGGAAASTSAPVKAADTNLQLAQESSPVADVIGCTDVYEKQLKSTKAKDSSGYNFRSDKGCKLSKKYAGAYDAKAFRNAVRAYARLHDIKPKVQKAAEILAGNISGYEMQLLESCQQTGKNKGSIYASRGLLKKSIAFKKILGVSPAVLAQDKAANSTSAKGRKPKKSKKSGKDVNYFERDKGDDATLAREKGDDESYTLPATLRQDDSSAKDTGTGSDDINDDDDADDEVEA
jgi:hypothetical protein